MQSKKSLGQNFLKDPKILKKIADFAQIEKEDLVVEIGPGEGALTEQLLKQAKKVVAIEKDEELARKLGDKFQDQILNSRLKILIGDILELRAESLELEGRNQKNKNSDLLAPSYKLVGNIPYYITGALFKKFLESDHQPRSITFVVQKEVAERILAKDGKESILSISVKAYGEPKFGGIIKAGSFYPKPKVDSAILAIRNISKEKFSSLSTENFSLLEKNFFEILKAGFAHKRKFLLRNLLEAEISGGSFDISKIREIFKNCGLEEKVRAEDLKIGDWLALTRQLT
jgi:16S rRNA (adenine1518-N6/adenine1519-N6)-dimethyltransferase